MTTLTASLQNTIDERSSYPGDTDPMAGDIFMSSIVILIIMNVFAPILIMNFAAVVLRRKTNRITTVLVGMWSCSIAIVNICLNVATLLIMQYLDSLMDYPSNGPGEYGMWTVVFSAWLALILILDGTFICSIFVVLHFQDKEIEARKRRRTQKNANLVRENATEETPDGEYELLLTVDSTDESDSSEGITESVDSPER